MLRPARLLIALAGVLAALAPPAAAQRPPGPPPAIPVSVAPVTAQSVTDAVSFVATVEASVSTSASAEVAGLVIEMPVAEGARVKAGTVLARLDVTGRQIQLRETQAAVAHARQELAKLRHGLRAEEIAQRAAAMAEQQALLIRAEADFHRNERLYRGDMISRAELDRLAAEFHAARQRHEAAVQAHRMAEAGPRVEEIAQAEAALAQATARADRIAYEIERATVRAPLTGHVLRKHVEVGAWVQPGDRVISLVALDPAFVTGPVGEREIARLRPGQPAQVAVDAYPGRAFEGMVTAVLPGADAGSRAFPVRITLQNPESLLKSGMLARVSVRTGAPRAALFVPKDAVVRRGGQDFVFVLEGETAKLVRVETGSLRDGLVEVRGPELASGQQAITLGNEFLQPGAKVRPGR